MAIISQKIIRYLTDRPGNVVYRDQIASDLDADERQVRDCIRRFQQTSAGSTVETVMRGVAWRYVPNRAAGTQESSDDVTIAPDPSLPLTTMIRQYMIDHPHTIIWADDLVAYTGKRVDQVKVGVNNMRHVQANQDVVRHVSVVINGQSWRFDPPPGWRPGRTLSPVQTTSTSSVRPSVVNDRPVSSTPRQTAVASTSVATTTTPTTTVADGRVFEEVGTAGNTVIIRDNDGVMYRAVPIT